MSPLSFPNNFPVLETENILNNGIPVGLRLNSTSVGQNMLG